MRLILVGAEQDADGWPFVRLGLLRLEVVEVEVHRPRILVAEVAENQINRDQALQPAVVEQQVDVVVLVVERDPPLTGHKTKPLPQLQQELLQVVDQCLFELRFGVPFLAFQPEELEDVRVADHLFGRCDEFAILSQLHHPRRIATETDALEEQAVELPLQLTHRPPIANYFDFVERPLEGIFDADEFHEMSERNLLNELRDVFVILPFQSWLALICGLGQAEGQLCSQ